MSKALRTAALVVGAVALVATGVGAAAGAGLIGTTTVTAAGTTLTSVAGLSAATLTSVGAIAGVASGVLSLGAGLTAKKPTATTTGSPDQFTANPDGGVPYVMGRFGTSGSIVFRRAWDTSDKGDNDRQSFVVVLSLGIMSDIESFSVDNVAVTFDEGGRAFGQYGGWMWQVRQPGTSPEPYPLNFGVGAGSPPGWDGNRQLSGLGAVSWTLRFDTKGEHYQNGVPKPQWVVKGVRAYDPRLDSTYSGGSGSQRANDETTWSYTENPYLHGLTWVMGRYQNGQRVMGVGVPLAGIDVAAFVEGANVADLNGWKVAGVAYSTDGKWDTLKKILQAGMGEPLQLGASVSCFVNAPKVSLATIGTADVVGDASVAATQPRRDRINGIVPRYWQETKQWQYLSGTAIRVPAHEAEDGGRRTKEQDYPFVPSDGALPDGGDKQIAVACRYDIENAREFGPIVLPLKMRWIGYKPGDCVTAVLPELGLAAQTILLLNRDFDPSSGIVTMTARSETAAKHPFALGQTASPPPTPGVSADPLVPVPGSGSFAITATAIIRGETTIPALVVQGAVDSPVAESVIFEYRTAIAGQPGDAGWLGQTELPPTSTGTVITGIAPGIFYEVGVSYRRRGVVGARFLLGPTQVGDLALDYQYVTGGTRPADNATNSADPNSPFGPGTVADAIAKIETIDQIFEGLGNTSAINIAKAALSDSAAEQMLVNLLLDEQAVRGAHAAVAAARQEVTQKINTDGAAEAVARTAVAAQAANAGAAVVVEQRARAAADQVQAGVSTSIIARLDNAGGSGVSAEAAIAANKTAVVDLQANKASTSDLTAAISEVNDNIAAAVEQVETEAGLTYAKASDLETLEAQVGGPDGLTAKVVDLQEVSAELAGKTTARFEQIAQVGEGVAGVRAVVEQSDGTVTADLALVADHVGIWIRGTDNAYHQVAAFDDGEIALFGRVAINGVRWDSLLLSELSARVAASWSGSITPSPGQTVTIPNFNLPIGTIKPSGFFLAQVIADISTNAGQDEVTTYNGKQLTTSYVADGGLSLGFSDNQGNRYDFPGGTVVQEVLATSPFSPTLTATISRGSFDTGIVNEGDSYSRIMSATYTITRLTVSPLRWSAI